MRTSYYTTQNTRSSLLEPPYLPQNNTELPLYGRKKKVILRSSQTCCEALKKHSLRALETSIRKLLQKKNTTYNEAKKTQLENRISKQRDKLNTLVSYFMGSGPASRSVHSELSTGGWGQPYVYGRNPSNSEEYSAVSKEERKQSKQCKDLLTQAYKVDKLGGGNGPGLSQKVDSLNTWHAQFTEQHASTHLLYLIYNDNTKKEGKANRLLDRLCCCIPHDNEDEVSYADLNTTALELGQHNRRDNFSIENQVIYTIVKGSPTELPPPLPPRTYKEPALLGRTPTPPSPPLPSHRPPTPPYRPPVPAHKPPVPAHKPPVPAHKPPVPAHKPPVPPKRGNSLLPEELRRF